MRRPASIKRGRWSRMWDRCYADLVSRGVWVDTDADVLERLVLNRAEAANALAVASADPWVDGSTGQVTAHPGFAVAARCDQLALSLARQLVLTPATRMVKGAGETEDAKPDPLQEFDELAQKRAGRTG